MKPKLSILICRLPSRYEMWERLRDYIWSQILDYPVQVLSDDRIHITIGQKRNRLLGDAAGDYVCFIDDDDMISENYIEVLMKVIDTGCDCASLRGVYLVDSKYDGIFEHSIKYPEWKTTKNEVKYERYPNHLNMIRASIAKQYKFPEIMWGEDHAWSKAVYESGLLKTEYYIPEVLYYYLKITKNVQPKGGGKVYHKLF